MSVNFPRAFHRIKQASFTKMAEEPEFDDGVGYYVYVLSLPLLG